MDWKLPERLGPESCNQGYKGHWRQVTNSVLLGSILDPILFSTFINDLDKGQSAPSASSQMTENQKEQLMYQMAVLPFN